MASGNATNLQRADSYESCVDLFAKISPAKATRRGTSIWSDNERPLGSPYQHHYRVARGPYHFDVILYSTTMARFHKPEEDGSYRVMYTWDYRNLSASFMHHVVRAQRVMELRDTCDTLRYVPLTSAQFGTDLVFTADGRLRVEESHHSCAYVPKTSEATKAWRKEFRERLSTICFLMAQTVAETCAAHAPDGWEAKPFTSTGSLHPLRNWDGKTIDAQTVEALRTMYRRTTEALMNRRAYNSQPKSIWSRHSGKSKPYVDPTPKEVTRSVLSRLYTGPWAPRNTLRVELPKFSTDPLPKNWSF